MFKMSTSKFLFILFALYHNFKKCYYDFDVSTLHPFHLMTSRILIRHTHTSHKRENLHFLSTRKEGKSWIVPEMGKCCFDIWNGQPQLFRSMLYKQRGRTTVLVIGVFKKLFSFKHSKSSDRLVKGGDGDNIILLCRYNIFCNSFVPTYFDILEIFSIVRLLFNNFKLRQNWI